MGTTDVVATGAVSLPAVEIDDPLLLENDNTELADQIQWLHPEVKIVTSTESIGYAERDRAAKSLPSNLAPIDLRALMNFINSEKPEDCRVKLWHALVDCLINVLRRQELATPGLTQALVRLYRDNDDKVLKDYAIQYLRYWYTERDGFYKHESDPKARELILITIVDAASRSGESYSGTALMALDHIATSKVLMDEPETQNQIRTHLKDLVPLLVNAACNSDTDKLCRITALQVCAMRGLIEILPTARELAADSHADTNIRISAIAAIGQLGTFEEDAQLLTKLEKEDIRLANAAIPALKKLTQ